MYKYNSKKNFEMTRQDFCALQDKKKKGDLEMCRASVLHARCSMRMLPQDGSIVQAGRGKSSFQAASEEIPSAFYSSLLLLAVSKLL